MESTRNVRCLPTATRIALLSGRSVPIGELAGRHEWAYGFSLTQRAIIPIRVTVVHRSSEPASSVEITIDSGDVVHCSIDQPFLMLDRTWSTTNSLAPGDRFMPLHRKLVSGGSTSPDRLYEKVWQPYYGFWEFTHRMVNRESRGRLQDRGIQVHHEDDDPLNNTPGNLNELTAAEHRSIHWADDTYRPEILSELQKARWARPGERARQAKRMRNPENLKRLAENLPKANAARRRSDIDWHAVHAEYISGATWLQLVEQFGVSKVCIRDNFRRLDLPLRGVNPNLDRAANLKNHRVISVAAASTVGATCDVTLSNPGGLALACGVFV